MGARGGLDLGFAYFSNIALAHDSINSIWAQYQGVALQIGSVLDSGLKNVTLIQNETLAYSKEAADLLDVYRSQEKSYQDKMTNLQSVIQARTNWRNAELSRLRMITDLDLARINMHRLMRTEEFEQVGGCWSSVQVQAGKLIGPCDDAVFKQKMGIK